PRRPRRGDERGGARRRPSRGWGPAGRGAAMNKGDSPMKIAFVGTGAMGRPMLANLVKKGHGVVAYDVVDDALTAATRLGAARASSSSAAAREGDLVITMLPSSSHVETAYLGSGGVLDAGVAAVAVSEAFRIAEGFGVDPKILTDVISKSSGNTWVMEHMHPVGGLVAKAPSSRDYAPGFTTDLMAKDLGLAVNAARDLRVPVVVAPAAQQVLRLASSHGLGRKDFSSVYV